MQYSYIGSDKIFCLKYSREFNFKILRGYKSGDGSMQCMVYNH